MRRQQPGIYIDARGAVHMDIPELCTALGMPLTPANQATIERAARRVIGDISGNAGRRPRITVREDSR
jgi:hypothetical protein